MKLANFLQISTVFGTSQKLLVVEILLGEADDDEAVSGNFQVLIIVQHLLDQRLITYELLHNTSFNLLSSFWNYREVIQSPSIFEVCFILLDSLVLTSVISSLSVYSKFDVSSNALPGIRSLGESTNNTLTNWTSMEV